MQNKSATLHPPPSAARHGDRCTCPAHEGLAEQLVEACSNVLVEHKLAVRLLDRGSCRDDAEAVAVARGARKVLIGCRPAARVGDPSTHGGKIATGARHVLIGDYEQPRKPGERTGQHLLFELSTTEKERRNATFVFAAEDN